MLGQCDLREVNVEASFKSARRGEFRAHELQKDHSKKRKKRYTQPLNLIYRNDRWTLAHTQKR